MGRYKIVIASIVFVVLAVLLAEPYVMDRYIHITSMQKQQEELLMYENYDSVSLTSNLSALQAELKTIKADLSDYQLKNQELMGTQDTPLVSSDNGVMFSRSDVMLSVTDIANETDTELGYLYVLREPTEVVGSYSAGQYSLAISGTYEDIVNFMEKFKASNMQYSVGAMSLKNNNTTSYAEMASGNIKIYEWFTGNAIGGNQGSSSQSKDEAAESETANPETANPEVEDVVDGEAPITGPDQSTSNIDIFKQQIENNQYKAENSATKHDYTLYLAIEI